MPVEYGKYHTYDNVLINAFNNDLLPQLKADVKEAVKRNVTVELANAIREFVYRNVYETYFNKQYIRRGDKGGLSDTSKYIQNVYSIGENETVAEISLNMYDEKGRDIVQVVETGIGYTWKNSEIYKSKQPRPFLDEALQEIAKDGSALGAVAEYLITQGWSVYKPYPRLHTPKKDLGNPNAISDALADSMFGDWAEDGEIF